MFCHGLFGQGRNWTGIAKSLAGTHRALLVDLPHHGRSGWSADFEYTALADEVAGLLSSDDPVALVGHSMGGKVAMVLALRHPELVARLCVVDIAPVDYGSSEEFQGYVEAMRGLDLDAVERRADADAALTEAVPNRTVRDFLLQNLRRDGDSGAGRPTSRSWATSWRRSAGGRRTSSTAWRRTRGRCSGSPAPSRATCDPSTRRRWSAGSRITAGSWSRGRGTGCTPSSQRCSPRCSGASSD